MAAVDYFAPSSEAEALRLLAAASEGELAIVAGGTDLLLDLDEGRIRPRRLLSLHRLPWRSHAWHGGALRIGATEPLRALESDPEVRRRLPALAQAIAAVGSPPLRRQATVGGNLGRSAPSSDLAPVLLALEAEVEIVGAGGVRSVPVDRFLLGSRSTALASGELVRSVRIAEPRPVSAYLWQRVRPANDISQIGVAVAWSPSAVRWRVALGGVPPRPVLVDPAAAALPGPAPAGAAVEAAAELLAASPALVSDRRATEEHRRRLAAVLLARAVAAATRSAGGAP